MVVANTFSKKEPPYQKIPRSAPGSYENAKSTTLEILGEAFSSEIVGLHHISLRLLIFEKSVDPSPKVE